VRDSLNHDDIERLEVSGRTPKAHRQAAATLVGWTQETNPDDEVTPADLLCAAAWHLGQAGDTEESIGLYRRAVSAEGTTTPDVRCSLHAALLEAGRTEEAQQVADQLRRSHPRLVDFADMAENYALAGDMVQAHRWAEMGVNRVDFDAVEPSDYEVVQLLRARRRSRQALGFPPDELDDAVRP
jgi:hypothetical protein